MRTLFVFIFRSHIIGGLSSKRLLLDPLKLNKRPEHLLVRSFPGCFFNRKTTRRPHALCLGIKTQKFSCANQKPERLRPFETGLVKYCPAMGSLFSLTDWGYLHANPKPQPHLFHFLLSESAFRPHETSESPHRNRIPWPRLVIQISVDGAWLPWALMTMG